MAGAAGAAPAAGAASVDNFSSVALVDIFSSLAFLDTSYSFLNISSITGLALFLAISVPMYVAPAVKIVAAAPPSLAQGELL